MTVTTALSSAAERPVGRAAASLRSFGWLLGGLLLVGLVVRLAVLASPLGEIDGDEAVVGLMARHIAFLGDRPPFFYGQHYLGSLEAFTAAPLFRLFGASAAVLKLVPTLYSLGFLWLSVVLARRLFGDGPALLTGVYLAVPPAMWAVWSTKARGGYAELLFLGEALLLATLWAAQPAARRWVRAIQSLSWGLLAGLAFWTHLLAVVYLVPCVVYLALQRPPRRSLKTAHGEPDEPGAEARDAGDLALGLAGAAVGMAPLLLYNWTNHLATLAALLQPADIPLDPWAQLLRFFRVGVPVLAGLGQPTTSAAMFDLDWPTRPAGFLPAVVVLLVLLALVLVRQRRAVLGLVGAGRGHAPGPALLVLLALCVPPVVALSRFGFFVSEPRYALPLYAAFPLVASALWRLPRPLRLVATTALIGLNVFSLVSSDVRLWRPEGAVDSTTATRAALVQHLVRQDRHQMYTDYWIAYPVMFETGETVLAYVVSSGFNRYIPPADNVQRTPNAVWVFVAGSDGEAEFTDQMRRVGAEANVAEVSVYRVYADVTPIDSLRPSRS